MYIFQLSIFGIQMSPTWYWLMYALGFIVCYTFIKRNMKFRGNDIDTLLYFVFFWVILWGRIGYILFYNPSYFFANPGEILAFWKGGMSFHGWFLGVLFAVFLFTRFKKYRFFVITDILAVIIPIALWLGRIGNYINKELLGFSPYDGPFAIVANGVSYFPSPLLEMTLEWPVLFLLTFWTWKIMQKSKDQNIGNSWTTSAIFLTGYAIARLIAEQFRLPDAQIGYLFRTDYITLGMLYTIPMLFLGIYILQNSRR